MRRQALTAIVFALVISSTGSHAATHRIDEHLEKCMAADYSTAGMTNCTNDAYSLWDKELNINYVNLMSRLSPSEKEAMRSSQRQWVAFRDLEFKAIDAIYAKKDGTMYIPMRVGERMEIVKARAIQMQGFLTLLDD